MRRILEAEPVDRAILELVLPREDGLSLTPLSSGTFGRRYHHLDR